MTITIRSIQHYLYCAHRWGLMEIDQAWAENIFVVKAQLVHKHAHTPDRSYSRGAVIHTDVTVWHDELDLSGKLDVLEEKDGLFTIVEYKPSAPKAGTCRDEDAMQLFAQKLCADHALGKDCRVGIYYANTKKRHILTLDPLEYRPRIETVLSEMRSYLRRSQIPPIPAGQSCSGCSMRDICMPSVLRGNRPSFKSEIMKMMENKA